MFLWLLLATVSCADEEGETSATTPELLTSTRWQVLHVAGRLTARALPLPESSSLKSLEGMRFTGPEPNHPFVLGDYSADGSWQLFNGYLLPSGKNAALQIGYADQFELEGILDATGLGGWFLLIGWDQGRGIAVSNVGMKDAASGSPWFITSFRGNQAIPGEHQEFLKYEWKGELPFKIIVKNQAFSLQVGRAVLFDQHLLENYAPGAVILGTYDTRYGPRKLRIKSLRIRAIDIKN